MKQGTKQWIGMICALWVYFLGISAVSGQEDLQIRLQELEKRLKQLEEKEARQAPEKTGEAAKEIQELRRQVDVLATELEKLRSGEVELELTEEKTKSLGLGPSAASIYRKKQGVSLAGYGELLFQDFADEDESGNEVNREPRLDFLRAILYTGYRFSDRFVFNSEIEFEHATTGEGDEEKGEVSLEFAYVEYAASNYLSLRGGLVLLPVGLINEFHEPNVFLGARRPETETRIIPTTWRENGVGIVGSAGMFSYRAYLINGLNASGFSSSGLREGRQGGSEALAEDLAFVGRLDITPTPGLFFGGSLYRGGSGQGQFTVNGKDLDVNTTLGEVHVQLQMRGLDFRGLYARALIDEVVELNEALGLTGNESIGKTLQGGYLQVGYNLLQLTRYKDGTRGFTPYFRFEKLNTQDEVPAGFEKDPSKDQTFYTLGVEFRPIYNIVIKTDYQWIRNEAESGVDQFNIALGYSF
jgi:cell division protein FtsB